MYKNALLTIITYDYLNGVYVIQHIYLVLPKDIFFLLLLEY